MKKTKELTEEKFAKMVTERETTMLYAIGILSNVAYSLSFDLESRLDKRNLCLKNDAKVWFKRLKANIKEQKQILHTLSNHYADYMDDENIDVYLHLTDIWESYICNLCDKLAIAELQPEIYQTIWNAIESCDSKGLIPYDVPNFKMIETREEFKEKE